MRRYVKGHALFNYFLIEEVERLGSSDEGELERLLHSQEVLLDRMITAITEAYALETGGVVPESSALRRARLVKKLLAGESLDTSDLAYDFDAFHIGAIAHGPGGSDLIKRLAKTLGWPLLLVPQDEITTWAWLGTRTRPDYNQFERAVSSCWPSHLSLASGEISKGISGWRHTHRQANAAFLVALKSSTSFVRYVDVAVLASVIQDDLLVASLRDIYFSPLAHGRDGGLVLRQTLRAYFSSDRNAASAAAALGVSRQTISNRLRVIEERLGRPLTSCGIELEAALRLEEVGRLP